MENVWVAFYSFVPLSIIGFCFSISSKVRKKLKSAENVNSLKLTYLGMKSTIKCKSISGLIIFAILSCFLLLYIICFCHVANQSMSEDWVRSSAVLVGLDLLVLELLPGVLFGVFGIFYGFCRKSKWFMCFLVAIEVYRLYRNMIEV